MSTFRVRAMRSDRESNAPRHRLDHRPCVAKGSTGGSGSWLRIWTSEGVATRNRARCISPSAVTAVGAVVVVDLVTEPIDETLVPALTRRTAATSDVDMTTAHAAGARWCEQQRLASAY